MTNQDKKNYPVAPGIKRINGEDVKGRKTMLLTPAEALFDLAQGRLLETKKQSGKKFVDPSVNPDPSKELTESE